MIYKSSLLIKSLRTVLQNFEEARPDPEEKGLELKAEETLRWKNNINKEPQNLNYTPAM